MENKKKVVFFKFIIIALFIIFIALFISQKTGYYDYGTYKKTILTKEAIDQFEKDVKAGKNISMKNYVTDIKKDYGNKVSNAGLFFSKKVDGIVKKGIDGMFTAILKMVDE